MAPAIMFCLAADAGGTIYGLVKGDPGTILQIDQATGAPSPLINLNRITSVGDVDFRNGTLFAAGLYPGSPGLMTAGAAGASAAMRSSSSSYGLAFLPAADKPSVIPLNYKALLAYDGPLATASPGDAEPGGTADPPANTAATPTPRTKGAAPAVAKAARATDPGMQRPTVAFAVGGLAVLLGWRRSRSRLR